MSNQGFPSTETYLIECSRENSLINEVDDENTNGSWQSSTNFNIRKNDQINIEMVCANIAGSGASTPTIELTGSNLTVGNKEKSYCDTKCLIEVFFYLNNNNTYTVGLPLLHPSGGINGQCGLPAVGGKKQYPNIQMPIEMPTEYGLGGATNTPGGRTNQPCNYRQPNSGNGYIYSNTIGSVPPAFQAVTTLSHNDLHYNIYQFGKIDTLGTVSWLAPAVPLVAGDKCYGVRIAQVTAAGYTGILFTNFKQGYVAGYQNNPAPATGVQCSFEIGQKLMFWLDAEDLFCPGTINKIRGGGNAPNAGNYLELLIDPDINGSSNGGIIPVGRTTFISPGVGAGACNPYIGDLENDFVLGWDMPTFNLKSFSSGIGQINYDNLHQGGMPTDEDLDTYHRGHNNALFNYADYIGEPVPRAPITAVAPFTGPIPAPSKNRQFPLTEFKPDDTVPRSTSAAGNFGSYLMPTTEPQRPQSGYRNSNVREECNNDPYIMMRNDCMGQGRRNPDGTETPRAKPMSAFIYIDVKELLQNIDSLADYINDRLHKTIEGMGNSSEDLDNLLNNDLQNPNKKKPSSNITPVYNRYGFYDYGAQDNVLFQTTAPGTPAAPIVQVYAGQDLNYKFQKIFTDVIPMKYGGCAKIIPANLSAGDDYLNTAFGRSWLSDPNMASAISNQDEEDEVVASTYLRRVRNQIKSLPPDENEVYSGNMAGFANPIYGNFATHDMYKFCLGDAWNRLPIWDGFGQISINNTNTTTPTTFSTGFTQYRVGKPIIINNYLNYTPLIFTRPSNSIYPYFDPESTPGNEPYPAPQDSVDVINVAPNTLYDGQLIYTNIEFPIEDTPNNDWVELAEAIRNYEEYNNDSQNAPSNIKDQENDPYNWVMDLDVGITDDRCMGQTNQDWGQPGNNPPPAGMIDYTMDANPEYDNYYQNQTPLLPDWMNEPCISARSDALALVYQIQYGTALGTGVGAGKALPDSYNVKRELFCPTRTFDAFAQAFATNTFDNVYFTQLRKALGRVKIKSRWDDKFKETSKNYKGFFAFNSSSLPPEPLDEGFREAFDIQDNVYINGKKWDPRVMLQFMKSLDLGFVPYIHYPIINITSPGVYVYDYTKGRVLCAVRVGADYTPKSNSLSSINFGQMTWGSPLGISPSFNDNHGIIPMNNDEIKQTDLLGVQVSASSVITFEKADRMDRYNMVNYIMTGATNPTFRYNTENGKCEFINLQQDNILNELATPYKKGTTDTPTVTAQIGDKCGIINSACGDACFGRLEFDGSDRILKTSPNKGIRAEISGVGILNIWLCNENYEPPPDINLSAYWDNGPGKGPVNFNNSNRFNKTEENRQRIIKGCTKASVKEWEGTLFSRLGFKNVSEILPLYGKQDNRYNPNTYNNQIPSEIGRGTKPLILCNETDNTINPTIHTFYTSTLSTTGTGGVTQPTNGEPLFSLGTINNEQSVFGTTSQALTASRPPTFTTSPFLLIESDICQTNYRSGKTQQNGLFYLMKNYSSNGYIYGYGSSYSHTANQDRLLSTITTQFRNPTTGRLQKCSKNSTIIYKITRRIVIPEDTTDVFGKSLLEPIPESTTNKLLEEILQVENFNSAGLSNIMGRRAGKKTGRANTRINRGHPRQSRVEDNIDDGASSVSSNFGSYSSGIRLGGTSLGGSSHANTESSTGSRPFDYPHSMRSSNMRGPFHYEESEESNRGETKTTNRKLRNMSFRTHGPEFDQTTNVITQLLGGLGALVIQNNPSSFFEPVMDEGEIIGYSLIDNINVGEVITNLIVTEIFENGDSTTELIQQLDVLVDAINQGQLNEMELATSLSELWGTINTNLEATSSTTPLMVFDPSADVGDYTTFDQTTGDRRQKTEREGGVPEGTVPVNFTENLGTFIYDQYIQINNYPGEEGKESETLGRTAMNELLPLINDALESNILVMEVPRNSSSLMSSVGVVDEPTRSQMVTAYSLHPDGQGGNLQTQLGDGTLTQSLHPMGTLNFRLQDSITSLEYEQQNEGFDMEVYEQTQDVLMGLGVAPIESNLMVPLNAPTVQKLQQGEQKKEQVAQTVTTKETKEVAPGGRVTALQSDDKPVESSLGDTTNPPTESAPSTAPTTKTDSTKEK